MPLGGIFARHKQLDELDDVGRKLQTDG